MELFGAGVDAGTYTLFDNSVAAHDSIENVYVTQLGKGNTDHRSFASQIFPERLIFQVGLNNEIPNPLLASLGP